MVLATLAFLLPGLVRHKQQSAPDRNTVNVEIVREQLAEVEARLERGEIDEAEWSEERRRLERDLALALQSETDTRSSGGWLTWPLAAAVPIAAGVFYLSWGTPAAIDMTLPVAAGQTAQQLPPQHPTQQPQNPAPDIRVVIERIRERIQQHPDDAEAWFMLGRAYMNVGEFHNAAESMREALQIDSNNVEVKVRLADALAMTRRGDMQGEPTQLLTEVLQAAPEHPQALWLMGIAQRDEGNHAAAIASWQQLVGLLGSDPRSQQEVSQLIAQSMAALGAAAPSSTPGPASPAQTTPASPAQTEADTADGLSVAVSLGDNLDVNVDPSATVFVYARAMQGPPMPLAVVRRSVADLPFTVTLTEADAMIPGRTLSSADRIVVGARIALSGQPIAQPGDVMGEIGDVDHRQTPAVEISLSQIVGSQ